MTEARPVGPIVAGWTPPPRPDDQTLHGRYCRLDKLDPDRHAALLFSRFEGHDDLWDYMPNGPFSSAAQYHRWMRDAVAGIDPHFYAIWDMDQGQYGGVESFLRITPEAGSIELGNICLAPCLQGTRAATEAFFLTMDWAFGVGYRRFEWKCNALNRPSRRAAQRLGFSFEGVFRQHMVVKGRNRDTAWFAIIDSDWSALREAYQVWLDPANFSSEGRQKESLSDLTRLVVMNRDPSL